jgi:hypothetical protein
VIEQVPPSGGADCDFVEVRVARSPGGPTAIDFRSTYGRGRVRWSDLPTAPGSAIARVEVSDGGLHLRGFSSLEGQFFSLGHSVDIVNGHVWLVPGRPVSVIGEVRGRVTVSTPSPGASELRQDVACADFGGPRARTANVGPSQRPPTAIVRAPTGLLAAPNEPVVFRLAAGGDLAWLEERNGFVHVASYDVGGSALRLDGWVRTADVTRRDSDFDRDFGDCADAYDRCMSWIAARATSVLVGPSPDGDAMGTLDAGTRITVVAHKGGYVSFTTSDGLAVPTSGAMWIAERDLAVSHECDE